ncbi:MAG: hypothetical protein NW220_12030 [Leptolyngbyaceae cyanobacterium bins.349]|nr:hypothetical protein [Leptolyngbyaceae cyanobacterium bins.349]
MASSVVWLFTPVFAGWGFVLQAMGNEQKGSQDGVIEGAIFSIKLPLLESVAYH